ncbi:MAG: tRNA-guanine transglycosylase [Myxococcota bacterium]
MASWADGYWLELLMAMIGEQFGELGEEICGATANVRKPKFYRYIYLKDEKWRRHNGPLDESCDCPCCTQVSAAYLHHLFNIEDVLAYRLATLHNLRFITRVTSCLPQSKLNE